MEPIAGAASAAAASRARQDTTAVTPELRRAARDFEAIFVQHLLQTMRRASLPGATGLGAGPQRIYQDLMDDQLARSIAGAGGLGLADLMIRDVARRGGGEKALKSPDTGVDNPAKRAGTPEGGAR